MGNQADFFGLPAHLTALEQPVATPALEVQRLVTRAWYLRQRDSGAAQADAKTAQDLLSTLPMEDAQKASGRLTLVRAENAWLFGDPETARELIEESRQIFHWAQDFLGIGDSYLCEAGHLGSQTQEQSRAVRYAIGAYHQATDGGDAVRLQLAEIWGLFLEPAAQPGEEASMLKERQAQAAQVDHAGIDLFAAMTRASQATAHGQRPEALAHLYEAFQAAQTAGQLYWAISLAQDIGQMFCSLHDEEGARQWVQHARDLEQPTGWPHAASRGLVQAASVQLAMGRERSAQDLLLQGLATLQRFPVSLNYVQAAQILGRSLLALREPQDALSWLQVSERVAMQLRLPGEVCNSLCLKARTLSQLGRADEALAVTQIALQGARAHANARCEAEVLHVAAEVARAHGLALPTDPQEAATQEVNAALHHMRQAFAVAEQVPGFFIPPSWHAELSQDHEALGDLALALQHQRLAAAGFAQIHQRDVAELAAAVRVRQRIEAEFVDAAQQRTWVHTQQDRTAVREAHQHTLEELTLVHQELAQAPDEPSLFAALGRHVDLLLDAYAVAVWRLQAPGGDALALAWGVADEQPLPPAVLPASAADAPLWRCLQARQELQLEGLAAAPMDTLAGSLPAPSMHGSALLMPLQIGDDTLGVLVVQSRYCGVYGDRERLILRSVAAACAQSLAGQARSARLTQAEAELDHQRLQGLFVQAGKMAAVARLAAHVAKEMTPSLSILDDEAHALTTALALGQAPDAAGNTPSHRLHDEIGRLGQLALKLHDLAGTRPPQLTAHDVRGVFEEARGLYGTRLATEHIVCDETIPPLTVQADTERLSLTIAHLVFNAADAMEGRADKHLWLSAVQREGEIALSVRDNGPGLPGGVSDRLFEPFFTTKPEGQGVGLGLALAAQSVVAMKGRITASNASEGGAVFTIVLPAA